MRKLYNKTFAKNLKLLRIENKLSQKEIAFILCVAPSTYSNYEQGIREPSNEILRKLCKYFNVTADYLLGLED